MPRTSNVVAEGSVWGSVSPGRLAASLFRESGTDARFSLESRHFDGLGLLSYLPLDRRCVAKAAWEEFRAGARGKHFEVS